ncbi:MAG: tetratricopeptide repeat protein [Acidobacteriota bacterium]
MSLISEALKEAQRKRERLFPSKTNKSLSVVVEKKEVKASKRLALVIAILFIVNISIFIFFFLNFDKSFRDRTKIIDHISSKKVIPQESRLTQKPGIIDEKLDSIQLTENQLKEQIQEKKEELKILAGKLPETEQKKEEPKTQEVLKETIPEQKKEPLSETKIQEAIQPKKELKVDKPKSSKPSSEKEGVGIREPKIKFQLNKEEKETEKFSDLYAKAEEFQKNEEWAKAKELWEKILKKKEMKEVYLNIGISLRMLKNSEEAEYSFKKALQIDPSYREALNNLGVLHLEKGEYEESAKILEKALSLSPNDYEILINLGINYFRLNELQKSYNCMKKVTEANPFLYQPYYYLGLIFFKLDNLKDAKLNFEKFLEFSPKNLSQRNWVESKLLELRNY